MIACVVVGLMKMCLFSALGLEEAEALLLMFLLANETFFFLIISSRFP